MGYDLHLKRLEQSEAEPLSLEEWLAALEAVEGVRPAESDTVVTNPRTGEEIRFPVLPGDAEIHFPEKEAWHTVLRFSNGRASLRHPDTWSSDAEVGWRVVASLCGRLDLIAVGDEGERYDPASGELIDD